MSFASWPGELGVALGAVREAAVLARNIRQSVGAPAFLKADRSPVTVADFAVQAVIAHRLHLAFPSDAVIGEENAASLRLPEARPMLHAVVDVLRRTTPDLPGDRFLEAIDRGQGTPGERFWTLDPVDGTQGFVRGDHYVVALALIVGGQVEIGLLGCPTLPAAEREGAIGSVIHAVRNHGTFRESLTGGDMVRLRVSSCRDARFAHVLRSVEEDHIDLVTFNETVRILDVETPPMLMDSQAKHALIAGGRADLLIRLPATPDFRDKIWDQAAGAIVIEEAGGRVTDRHGADLDFGCGRTLARNAGMIGSNGDLHSAVIEALRLLASGVG